MMSTIQCEIVSAEEAIFSGAVETVIATGMLGDLGVSHGHSPLITGLKPGPVRVVTEGDEEQIYYVSGGFLEVQPDVVTILADTAIRADDLDEAAALEAQKAAEQDLANQSAELDYTRAATELAAAAAQLRTISQIRKKLGK
ncbi:MAG: F0F1 ATP synthase subunit epsilon [Gammaproteobacteria bacterium]|nr:F0F1 ATP synthase subunit epsilon [Gammaproteobacteria bacterium]MBT8151219.1 F0F1 ATP synthase subunit epsilon [Gammaproteobacteria bacterium]NND37987.1 F0F1 ATP synthase subunit epsilon [Pseudomonadales bacterium]NNL11916.1 F0F1 ATP synthase subunit epsilon [Pseudomonadales bacterium]NNM10490.1 F0F1 ATP synthase subunit epsilon [Pseudomonadales bacterium]